MKMNETMKRIIAYGSLATLIGCASVGTSSDVRRDNAAETYLTNEAQRRNAQRELEAARTPQEVMHASRYRTGARMNDGGQFLRNLARARNRLKHENPLIRLEDRCGDANDVLDREEDRLDYLTSQLEAMRGSDTASASYIRRLERSISRQEERAEQAFQLAESSDIELRNYRSSHQQTR